MLKNKPATNHRTPASALAVVAFSLATCLAASVEAIGGVPAVWNRWAYDGRFLFGFDDSTLLRWDAASGRLLDRTRIDADRAGSLGVATDGKLVVADSELTDNGSELDKVRRLRLFVLDARRPKPVLDQPGGRLLARNAAGDRLVISDERRDLGLWTDKGVRIMDLKAREGFASIEFSADGRSLLVKDIHGYSIVDARTGETKARNDAMGSTSLVRLSADADIVLTSASNDARGKLLLWDVKSGGIKLSLPTTIPVIRDASLTPDGRMIVTTHADRTVRVWDAARAEERSKFDIPKDSYRLEVSPDSRRALVTWGGDYEDEEPGILVDLATGREIVRLTDGRVVSFSRDGRTLLSIVRPSRDLPGWEAVIRESTSGKILRRFPLRAGKDKWDKGLLKRHEMVISIM